MLNFTFCAPTKFVFGRGAENQAGAMLTELGVRKVLIHYGGGSCVRSGLLARVEQSVQDAGIEYVTLGGAQPNPRSSLVRKGIDLIRREGVEAILAAGAGSVIASSTAMAVGADSAGGSWDFYCGKAVPQTKLPLGVVLTMAAAGSEASNSCVITNDEGEHMLKRGLNTELNRPQFALENPELTTTLPAYQTACGITDIMAHVLERYFTNAEDCDLTDRLCEAVLGAVISAAPVVMADPDNYEARATLMWASTLAHNNSCGVGRQMDFASHQLEHELSAKYDVAHGAGLAVVFPAWMKYVFPRNPKKFAQLAVRLWGCEMDFEHPERTALEGIRRYEDFLRSLGMPLTFAELGAEPKDIPELARGVKRNNGDKVGYFVPLDNGDLENIYRLAVR